MKISLNYIKTMWKALIKLVEKWSYRCDHDWVLVKEVKVFDEHKSTGLPRDLVYAYRCTKCCEFKKLKL